MKISAYSFLLISLLSCIELYAQVDEVRKKSAELSTDRPDQTESPAVVPPRALQIETGFAVESDASQSHSIKNYTYNTTLLRYGLTDHIELRFVSEYIGVALKEKQAGNNSTFHGFAPLTVGIKIAVTEEKGFVPQIGFIGHLTFPSGSQAFESSFVAPAFRFSFEHTLNHIFSLGYNIGAEWDGEIPNATTIYTLTLAMDLSDRLGFFIEGYGFMPEKSAADHRIDSGFTYAIKNNLQLDLSAGLGLSPTSPNNFIGMGLSGRFPY